MGAGGLFRDPSDVDQDGSDRGGRGAKVDLLVPVASFDVVRLCGSDRGEHHHGHAVHERLGYQVVYCTINDIRNVNKKFKTYMENIFLYFLHRRETYGYLMYSLTHGHTVYDHMITKIFCIARDPILAFTQSSK